MVAGSCPKSCDSRIATFVVKIWSHMGPIKWHGFSLGEQFWDQLQQWRPRDWQDYGCSQDKQSYLCIMAGLEFEKYAIGHEVSNQQSEKQGLAKQHKAGLHSEHWSLPTTLQLHFFALHNLYLGPV